MKPFTKYLTILLLLAICKSSFAIICPAPSEIRQGKLHHWLAFNTNNGYPAHPEWIKDFMATVGNFYLAQWSTDYPDGPGQCYYHSHADVYLVKAVARPTSQYWQWRHYLAECKLSREFCKFG